MKKLIVAAFAASVVLASPAVAGPKANSNAVADNGKTDRGPSPNAACQAQYNDNFGGSEAGDINGLGNKSKYWQDTLGASYVTPEFEADQRNTFRLSCSTGE